MVLYIVQMSFEFRVVRGEFIVAGTRTIDDNKTKSAVGILFLSKTAWSCSYASFPRDYPLKDSGCHGFKIVLNG